MSSSFSTPRQPSAALSSGGAFLAAIGGVVIASRLGVGLQAPTQPEDVAVQLGTVAFTVTAAWWLANVLAWTSTLRRGGTIDRFTLPGSKRIAQLLLAAALSTSCVAEATADPVMVLVAENNVSSTVATATAPTTSPTTSSPTTSSPTTSAPATSEPTTPEPTNEVPPPVGSMPIERSIDPLPSRSDGSLTITEHQRAVVTGDNLWSLAAETLAAAGAGTPTCEETAGYWSLVVAANRVQSGNPNLIAVGETITLPAYEFTS